MTRKSSLEAQFGDAAYPERGVRRRCQYVQQRREVLYDKARSSRPPIDFLDIRILALLGEPFFIRLIRLLKPRVFPTQPY
jgi:hypothetical protein